MPRFRCMSQLILVFVCIELVELVTTSDDDDWVLVDDYRFDRMADGHHLHQDTDTWAIDDEPENLCRGENMFQFSCHRRANVFISGGRLTIEATANERARSSRYLFNTGKLSSRRAWLYGRFELRARLPDGRLLRPVFVLRPSENRYRGDWLANGQINALVYAQAGDFISSGLHYQMPGGQSYVGGKFRTKANITDTFHAYGLEWTNQSIRWMFDGLVYMEHPVTAPFDQPFYFTLQLGVGGPEFDQMSVHSVSAGDAHGWKHNKFVVEYIKVFQQRARLAATSNNTANKIDCCSVLSLIVLVLVVNIKLT